MKFSGHETFHVRDGWLHKGLTLIRDKPSAFGEPYAHDALGVGSNMAKSIRHWLDVTGLARAGAEKGALVPTSLGRIILTHDPFFADPLTWWVLHINLVANEASATTWHWFFNYFYQVRFEKKFCVDTLRRYLTFLRARLPSRNTLERDVQCLLASYASVFPEDPTADPEDSYDCPFQELGLLTHFRETDTHQFAGGPRPIPPAALLYSLSRTAGAQVNDGNPTILLSDASTEVNGPGKSFALAASDLFDLVDSTSRALGEDMISITGMAGERAIRYRRQRPEDWVSWHFRNSGGAHRG